MNTGPEDALVGGIVAVTLGAIATDATLGKGVGVFATLGASVGFITGFGVLLACGVGELVATLVGVCDTTVFVGTGVLVGGDFVAVGNSVAFAGIGVIVGIAKVGAAVLIARAIAVAGILVGVADVLLPPVTVFASTKHNVTGTSPHTISAAALLVDHSRKNKPR